MSHRRPPAIAACGANASDSSPNDAHLDDLPREELLRMLKALRRPRTVAQNTAGNAADSLSGGGGGGAGTISSRSSSSKTQKHSAADDVSGSGSSGPHGGSRRRQRTLFAGAVSTASSPAGSTRGGVGNAVAWDAAPTSAEDEEDFENARNSPNDQHERDARRQSSLCTISAALSPQRASASAKLPNASTAPHAEEEEDDDAASEAEDHARAFVAAVAVATKTEMDDSHSAATEDESIFAAESRAPVAQPKAAAATSTAVPSFTSPIRREGIAQPEGPFSPFSGVLEVDSVSSPRSSMIKAAASLTSAALRYAHSAANGRSANRYSCSSLSSSTYDTVDYSVAESTLTALASAPQTHLSPSQQQSQSQSHFHSLTSASGTTATATATMMPTARIRAQQRQRSPQQGGQSLTVLQVCQDSAHTSRKSSGVAAHATPCSPAETLSPVTLSAGAMGDRFSPGVASDVSFRPTQLETLPPPQDLSLRGAQISSRPHFLSLSSSMSASEALATASTQQQHHEQQQQQVRNHLDEQAKDNTEKTPFSLSEAEQHARQAPIPRLFNALSSAPMRHGVVRNTSPVSASTATVRSESIPMPPATSPRARHESPSPASSYSSSSARTSLTAQSSCAETTTAASSRLSAVAFAGPLSMASSPPYGPSPRSPLGVDGENAKDAFCGIHHGSVESHAAFAAVEKNPATATPTATAATTSTSVMRAVVHEGEVTVVDPSELPKAVVLSLLGHPPSLCPAAPMPDDGVSGGEEKRGAALVELVDTRDAPMRTQPSTSSILQPTRNNSFGRQSPPPTRSHAGQRASLAPEVDALADSPRRPPTTTRQRGGSASIPQPSSVPAAPSSSSGEVLRPASRGPAAAAHNPHSPHPRCHPPRRLARQTSGRHPKPAVVVVAGSSSNTLVSVDTAHTLNTVATNASVDVASLSEIPLVGAAHSVEFNMWTHIVSWDKGECSHGGASTGAAGGGGGGAKEWSRQARGGTPTTVLTASSSPTPSSQSDQRRPAPALITSAAAAGNTRETHDDDVGDVHALPSSSSQADSVLALSSRSSRSSSAHEAARARETVSLRRIRHARTGDRYINNYRVLKSLGRGSCGKVKLAFDESECRLVAIKNVRRADTRKRIGGMTAAQKQYNAFMREIEVMKKLRHRNIVSLYEVIDDPNADKLYLVMQYVDKGVVAKVEVRANSDLVCDPVPPALLAQYAREMLTGLQYLHRHDVVHRDLKPDNILVSKDGHAYLADFGVAETFDTSYRQRRENMMAQSMAVSMAMSVAGGRAGGPQVLGTKGTPLFIAPELWNGAKSYGKPVDMWAMGVTLFTLLVGKLPFRSPEDITDPDITPTVPQTFSESWRVLLAGLLNRDPKARWTVEEALANVASAFRERRASSGNERSEGNLSKASSSSCESGAAAASTTSAPSALTETQANYNTTTASSARPLGQASGSLRASGPKRRPSPAEALLPRAEPRSPAPPLCGRTPWQLSTAAATTTATTTTTTTETSTNTVAASPPANERSQRTRDKAFRHTISAYPSPAPATMAPPSMLHINHTPLREAVSSLTVCPMTFLNSPAAFERHESLPRPHGLEEVVAPRLASRHARCGSVISDTVGSVTHTPTPKGSPSTPLPLPRVVHPVPPPHPQQPRDASSAESADCPGLPSFEGSVSDAGSATPPSMQDATKEAASMTAYEDLPHHQQQQQQQRQQQQMLFLQQMQLSPASAAAAYRPFASRRASRRLSDAAPLAAIADLTQLLSPGDADGRAPSLSDAPMHATSPWAPLSNTSTAQSGELTSIASSLPMPSATVTSDEAGGPSTSVVYSSVLSARLLPPSVPRPYSSRQSEKDNSISTPVLHAGVAPYLTASYHSRQAAMQAKEERGSSVSRQRPISPFGLMGAATSDISSHSSNSSSLATAGRTLPYALHTRSASTQPLLDSRERSPRANSVEAGSSTGGMNGGGNHTTTTSNSNSDAPPPPRSPARLPGISLTIPPPIPSPPLCTPVASTFSAPSALRPIQRTSPSGRASKSPALCRRGGSPTLWGSDRREGSGDGGGGVQRDNYTTKDV